MASRKLTAAQLDLLIDTTTAYPGRHKPSSSVYKVTGIVLINKGYVTAAGRGAYLATARGLERVGFRG